MKNKDIIENPKGQDNVPNNLLLIDLKKLIENTKNKIIYTSNAELVILHWNIGKRIQEDILQNQRADYGDQIVATLSQQLTRDYGRGFMKSSLLRMVQFYKAFPDLEIVATLSRQFI